LSLVRKLPTAMPYAPAPSGPVAGGVPAEEESMVPSPAPPAAGPRPIVRPTAPERYRVQFTIGEATHEKLRRLQALLRREIPSGDPGVIFDRAVTLPLENISLRGRPQNGCEAALVFGRHAASIRRAERSLSP